MGGKPNLPFLRAEEILANHDWQDYNKVRMLVAKAVPPGVAFRSMEKQREWNIRKRHGLGPKDPLPDGLRIARPARSMEDIVRSGQRHVAAMTLQSTRFERKGDMIRLRPKKILSPEQRKDAAARGRVTRMARHDPKEIAARSRATLLARYTPEQRFEIQQRAWKTRLANGENPGDAARRVASKLTPEERSARTKKGWETRRRANDS